VKGLYASGGPRFNSGIDRFLSAGWGVGANGRGSADIGQSIIESRWFPHYGAANTVYFLIAWRNWKIIQQKRLQWQALCVYYASSMRQVLTDYLRP